MVRRALLAALLAISEPALSADWRAAGGALFVGSAIPGQPLPASLTPAGEPLPFADEINAAAQAHGLDPELLRALVITESAYEPSAISPAGAAGLAQLMPATAAELGVSDRLDPQENLMGGAAYLARQVRDFGDLALALAAYNAGPARVRAHAGFPPIAETETYVRSVLSCFLALEARRDVRSPAACAAESAALAQLLQKAQRGPP